MSDTYEVDLYETYESITSSCEFIRDSYGAESRELTIASTDPRMAAISTILTGLNVEKVDSLTVLSRFEPAWLDDDDGIQPAHEEVTVHFNRPEATKIYTLTKYDDNSVSVHKTWLFDDEAQRETLQRYMVAATTGVGVADIADQLELEEVVGMSTVDSEEFLVLTALSKILS